MLRKLEAFRVGCYVFPTPWQLDEEKHVSMALMALVLKRMDRRDITVHGFRSTFRDWVAERTNYPQRAWLRLPWRTS